MRRKKIVLNTNPPWIFTGLAENGRLLAQHLAKTNKYDLVYYCSQAHVQDANHGRQPWKSRGCVPPDPNVHTRIQQDQMGYGRWVFYGNLLIGDVIKEEKPDIFLGSDDIWTWGKTEYWDSSWWKQINPILHITVDSVPVSEMAYEQAKVTPSYFTWAKFGAAEMRRRGAEWAHVKQIYGATDVANFAPLSPQERKDIRKRFNISEATTIIGYTFRNQLRKEAGSLLAAFHEFKKENPSADVKLHLHTSWSETASGWDIPRLMKYYGIDQNDVLCTYVCKNCGNWLVSPYGGEDANCPFCKSEKSMVTASIAHGVPHEEMKWVYGIRDATISPLTSGGQEYECVNTLLCGLPLACTNYSSGEDFCAQSFVQPINWHLRFEAGSSFQKATNDISSMKSAIRRFWKMSASEKQKIGEESRDWAAKTFSIETIGAQWEAIFDSLPLKDWSSISLTYKPKNPDFPMPSISSDEEWVRSLYNNILLCDPDPDGFKHWLQALQNKTPREAIYNFFVGRAREDNAKNSAPSDFWSILDTKRENKRAIMIVKESIGDVLMMTSLFESFHKQYPEHDLYVATEQKHFEVLAGNSHVFKAIPYQQFMENELAMTGAGTDGMRYFDVFLFPTVGSQKCLSYLSANNPILPSTS